MRKAARVTARTAFKNGIFPNLPPLGLAIFEVLALQTNALHICTMPLFRIRSITIWQ